ncbi:MAG: T9SS type A sorting domain-containing protein, partial [Bacteroidetes bacterium]
IYEGIDTIRGGVGESFYFKFWYEDNNWESISDRVFTFADSNITSGEAFINESFNNGTLETVLNQPATITFTCNTNGAISSVTNNPFASVQSVHVAGSASPLQWPSGGWPNSEINIVLELFDDGSNGDATAGDGIFSADITFPSFTVLDVQYKYSINWGIDSLNEGGNDNEAGFAVNHELHMTKNLSSATTVDTFGVMGDVTLENPVGIGNDNSGILPLKFGLNQNYPNPFNPSTQIKYTLAAASPVMLKVYDMLGREVETLVNGTQNAGEYTLSFSAKNLPSGVYYYRLTTSNFVETKTMMLVK